jgi:hypothetical protein
MLRTWLLSLFLFGWVSGASLRGYQEDTADQPAVRTVPAAVAEKSSQAQRVGTKPAAAVAKAISKEDFEATHSEISPLSPRHDGQPVQLNSFRLDDQGNLVACLSANTNGRSTQGLIQVYSPELTLVREFATPFIPTAITIDPSGNYLAAGEGRVGKFTAEGTVVKIADAPNLSGQNPDEVRQRIIEDYKESMKASLKVYEQQISSLEEQIETLEAKQEEDPEAFSKRDKTRLKALAQQLTSYQSIKEQFTGEVSDQQIEAMMKYRSNIPSIAATAQDIFVTTSSGMGYEVWRTDANLENPVRVVEGLRGCCGQMDIYAHDDQLLIAENTRFQVGVYDRDGNSQSAFGERAKNGDNGFGSCCNPMNVICCSNGDILTAESSIGKIKRFSADGEMLGYVGKARIGAGCKHVALGYDPARDRYYIQYQDKNQVCILVPNAEADKLLVEKREKQAAGEKIVQRIEGTWIRDDQKADADRTDKTSDTDEDDSAADESQFDYAQFVESMTNFRQLQIDLDKHHFGVVAQPGNPLAGDAAERNQNYRWAVASSADDQVSLELEDQDGMVMFGAEIKILDDRTIQVRFSYDAVQQFGKPKNYVRQQASSTETTTAASTGD